MYNILKRVSFLLILILGFVLIFALNNSHIMHDAENVYVNINGHETTLQKAINNKYIMDYKENGLLVGDIAFGHSTNEIWVSINGSDMTLHDVFLNKTNLCGSSFYPYSKKISMGHFADSISVSVNGSKMTLQKAINSGIFCYRKEMEKKKVPIVFILSGQSNMFGVARVENLTNKNLLKVPHNVDFYYVDRDKDIRLINSLKFQYDRGFGVHFGPEISLMHKLSVKYPDRKVIIIKFAVGGTSINRWVPSSGEFYQDLINYITKVVSNFSQVEYGGIFWLQGESDALHFNKNFLLLTKGMLKQLRLDLNATSMEIFIAKIHPGNGNCPWAINHADILLHISQIRKWQESLGNEMMNTHIVDTKGLSCYPTGKNTIHFNEESQVLLGNLFME